MLADSLPDDDVKPIYVSPAAAGGSVLFYNLSLPGRVPLTGTAWHSESGWQVPNWQPEWRAASGCHGSAVTVALAALAVTRPGTRLKRDSESEGGGFALLY